jgi:hypothetical protein
MPVGRTVGERAGLRYDDGSNRRSRKETDGMAEKNGRARRRNRIRVAFVLAAVSGVAVAGSVYVSASGVLKAAMEAHAAEAAAQEQADAQAAAESAPMSTPASEWVKGEFPYIYQIDPQWKDEPYLDGTIEDTGCGPTALTIAYAGLTGNTDYDPVKMAQFTVDNGYVADGMTAWTLMDDGAEKLGLSSTQFPVSAENLVAELEAGNAVIVSVGPGDFTDKGHFMVAVGVAPNGSVYIRDPNSVENSSHTWSAERIASQAKGMWAVSAA